MASSTIPVYKNFIGGEWVEAASGRTYPVYNPAHKTEVVGEFQTSDLDDAQAAVAAAKAGLKVWANTPAPGRAAVLFRALEILGRRADEIARAITTEEGKPIGDAHGEVRRAMNIIEYAAGEGRRMFGYTTPSELPNTVAYTIKRPLGVVGIITPWNFPIAIPAWKIAPALICGNALVFKPASSTPLCAVKLAEVFEEAGLPAGVLNLITGPGARVGNALVEHPDVNGISFTGSTEIGTELYGNGARSLKKVQAEMGGKNAVILLADADMDKALGGIVQGAFGSTGQRCTATSRVIVEETVYDEFMDGLIDRGQQAEDRRRNRPYRGRLTTFQPVPIRQGAGVYWRRDRGRGPLGLRWSRPHRRRLRPRVLRRAHGVHRGLNRYAHRQRGDFRPGADGI